MYLCLIITIDRERSTLLVRVNNGNTVCACVYFTANVGKLSYLLIALKLMGHAMVFNVQCISSTSISYQDG